MIETSSKHFQKYWATFGNPRKFSENDRKCSCELRRVFGKFSKILENLQKILGNRREIAKISLILL